MCDITDPCVGWQERCFKAERERAELLAACKEALETIEDWGNGDRPMAKTLRAVIAEAEGEG
jgi:hypothetical protein